MTVTENETRALEAVAYLETPTRKSISEHASLSLVVVSSALSSLERKRCVTRSPRGSEKGGRPAYVYALHESLGVFAGVSLEPQTVRIVAMSSAGHLLEDREYPLSLSPEPSSHPAQIVDQVHDRLRETVAAAAGGPPLLSVGVTLPGLTNADQGIWVHGFQVTGVSHVNLREVLSERFGVPVLVDDPARAVAFHELRRGAGRGAESFVLLYLGFGVGSGIVFGSRLLRGHNGLSGEAGHLVVDPAGYRCSCGDVGCLETVASTSGLLRLVRERLEQGVVSRLLPVYRGEREPLRLEDVLRAADEGDRLAESTLHEVGEHIGDAASKVIKILNPERLLVSGKGSMFRRYFEPRIQMVIQRHVMPDMLEGFSLVFTDYMPHHDAFGAALMSSERYWQSKVGEFDDASVKSTSIGGSGSELSA
jgi:predicted NBD/HSP70 family sugar kinase